MVQFESLIERDLIYLLDFNPRITSFADQPLTISYRHNGKLLNYTPDFHVAFATGANALIECKPLAFVDSDDNQRKFAAAREWCAERDWQFHVVTDVDLKAGHRVANVKLLTQHARHAVDFVIKNRITHFLATASTRVTIAGVMTNLNPGNPTAAIVPILHMAFHHEVHLPLNEAPITADSPISLPQFEANGDEHPALFYG